MKKKSVLLVFVIFTLCYFSCATSKDARNSRDSLDWVGVYKGFIPAADTSGIDVQITLNSDETYSAAYIYADTDGEVFNSKGTFKWDENGNIITMSSGHLYYRVEKNALRQLDIYGKVITGQFAENYVLKKQM